MNLVAQMAEIWVIKDIMGQSDQNFMNVGLLVAEENVNTQTDKIHISYV